jgi:alanyl-tRNA synthetase
MTSDRLYYTDSYLVEFDAIVRDLVQRDGRWIATLDRTAFYPTSGGQPFDVGTLGDATVVDVFDQEDGTVGHLLDRELDKNSRIRGRIDWDRRFDHMQQHTGQHVFSAALEKELGARTVSFHLGTATATIDLDKDLSTEQIAQGEAAANAIVWENREICVKFVTAQEAAKLPLRKEPTREGDLRIVEIEDYDMSACGGTHVSRTGAIGMIAVAGSERFKGGVRVEFVCGQRALRVYRGLRDTVSAGVRLLSVLPEELPSAIEKLQAAGKAQQKAQDGLRERLAIHEAAALAAKGEEFKGVTIVAEAVTGWDVNGLKKLASTVASNQSTVAVLVTTEVPTLVVIARSRDITIDAGAVLAPLLSRFGGKGGGKGSMAQGGGLSGNTAEILNAAKDAILSGAPTQ